MLAAVQLSILKCCRVAGVQRYFAQCATEAVQVKDQIPGAHHQVVTAKDLAAFGTLSRGEDSANWNLLYSYL